MISLTLNGLNKAVIPRIAKILNIEEVIIEEGKKANMTLFDPEIDWVFNEKDIKSKSKNTPFIGEKLKGKALAVINNGELEKC